MRFAFVLAILSVAFFTAESAQADYSYSPQTVPLVGVRISSPLDSLPSEGIVPLIIEIRNDTRSTQTWRLSTSHGAWSASYTSSAEAEFLVDAGQARRFTVLIDLFKKGSDDTRAYNYSWDSFKYSLEGYGVTANEQKFPQNSRNIPYAERNHWELHPYALFSPALAKFSAELEVDLKPAEDSTKDKSELKKMFDRAEGFIFNGSKASLTSLSDDWRSYISAKELWITSNEWRKLLPEVRDAILEWTMQGGVLFIAGDEESPAIVFDNHHPPLPAQQSVPFGLGSVFHIFRGNPPGEGEFLLRQKDVRNLEPPLSLAESNEHDWTWGLIAEHANKMSNGLLLVAFVLIAYSLIVGPCNILWLRRRNPLILYVSTPLIAAVGTGVLLTTIVFRHGIGGEGSRQIAVLVMPENKRMLSIQEQAGVVGVMPKSSFELDDDTVLRLISLPGYSPGEPLAFGTTMRRLERTREVYDGQFFLERASSAHVLERISLSRAKVELVRTLSNVPIVQSSLPVSLDYFVYVDGEGLAWEAEGLHQGTRIELRPARNDWETRVFLNARTNGGQAILTFVQRISGRRKFFYATTADASPLMIQTSRAVRWHDHLALIAGTMNDEELAG